MDNNRRKAILDAAYRLFSEKGYESTSIRDLCKATNLTAPGLYHHIKSKEELLNQVEQHVFKHFLALFHEHDPDEKPEKQIERLVREFTELILEHRGIFFLLVARIISPGQGDSGAESRKRRKQFVEAVREILEGAKKQGKIRKEIDTLVATFALIAMANWVSVWYDPNREISKETLLTSLATLFIRGVLEQQ